MLSGPHRSPWAGDGDGRSRLRRIVDAVVEAFFVFGTAMSGYYPIPGQPPGPADLPRRPSTEGDLR